MVDHIVGISLVDRGFECTEADGTTSWGGLMH
jgi:hypothetical protein